MTDQTTSLNVRFTGDSSGLVEEYRQAGRANERYGDELDQTTRRTERFTKASKDASGGMGSLRTSLNSVAKAAAVATAAITTTAAVALSRLVKDGLAAGDSLAKVSDKLGITTEALASMRLAAQRSGVETNRFDTALQRLTRRTAEAAAGTGEAQAAFKALGLEAAELVRLSPDQALARVADRMATVENQSQRVALAFKLFDTEGVALVNTLRDGSSGLAAYQREAQVLGLTLSRDVAGQIEAANDSMARIGAAFTGFGQQLAGRFAPILQGIADRLFGVAEEAGGMGKVAEQVFNFLIAGAGKVAKAIDVIRVAWNIVKTSFNAVAASIAKGWELLLRGIGQSVAFFNEDVADPILRAADSLEVAFRQLAQETTTVWDETKDAALRYGETQESLNLVIDEYQRRSREASQVAISGQQELQTEVITTENVIDSMARTTAAGADAASRAWNQAASSITRSLTGLVGIGGGGFGGIFSNVLSGAVTSGVTGPTGTGGGGANLGFLGALGAGATGVLSGFGGLATSAYRGIAGLGLPGAGLGARFLTNNAAFGARFGLSGNAAIGAGALGSIGGGLLGGFAGRGIGSLFGGNAESNIGSTIGGIGGSFFGPVGAFVGSGIGGLIDSISGGDGKKRFNVGIRQGTGLTESDRTFGTTTAASGLAIQGINRRGGAEGQQAAQQFLDTLLGLDEALTGLLGSAGVAVDFSRTTLTGVRADAGKSGTGSFFGLKGFNGVTGSLQDSAEDFVEAWLDEVNDQLPRRVRRLTGGIQGTAEELVSALEVALSIDELLGLDVVRQTEEALAAMGRETQSMLDQYEEITDAVIDLASSSNTTVGSLMELNDALLVQKGLAVELAVAYREASVGIDSLLGGTITSIREALLTDEELYGLRREQIDSLTGQLQNAISPDEIAAIVQQIDALSRSAFGLLDEGQQQQLGGEFIEFLQNAGEIADARINAGLRQLDEAESTVLSSIDFELANTAAQTQAEAAQITLLAGNRLIEVADAWEAIAERFGLNFSSNIGEINA